MTDEEARPQRGRRLLRRVLAGFGITVLVLAAVAGLLYALGTMQTPSAEARAAFDRAVASGRVEPVASRFHIPIPGCVCHSDDPVVQMRHSTRYIRECGGCHGG